MNRTRLSRLWAAGAGLSLVALSAFAPVASAAPPNWVMNVETLPPTVQPGANAGFVVSITNNGPSNISALWLTDDVTASPILAQPEAGSCLETGQLLCSLGALNAGATVKVLVVYATPTNRSTFAVNFQGNTNGETYADNKKGKPGTSRGDTLTPLPEPTTTVALDPSADFGGGFVVSNRLVSNSTNLSGGNPQSTQVEAPTTLIPATVKDGVTTNLCPSACTHTQFGQVSEVNVAKGEAFGSPFKIVMTIRGQSLSGPRPNASTLVVYHELDGGALEIIGDTPEERCDSGTSPTDVPAEGCVIASYAGNTLQIVVWSYYNGKFRGAV